MFLGKELKSVKSWLHPQAINKDKAEAFSPAIRELKKEGNPPSNIAEADHRKLKWLQIPCGVSNFFGLYSPPLAA